MHGFSGQLAPQGVVSTVMFVCWVPLGWSFLSHSTPRSAVSRTCSLGYQRCFVCSRVVLAQHQGWLPGPPEQAGWGGQPEGGHARASDPNCPTGCLGKGLLLGKRLASQATATH